MSSFRKIRFAFPAALAALALLACGREKVVEKYPKGEPKTIRTYGWFGGASPDNLVREQTFYFNGHKEKDACYRKGVLNGLYVDFWHNGQKRSDGKYVDGKRQGEWEFWFNQYTLSSKGLFKDDEKEGPWNSYWENGALRAQAVFKGGQEIGVRKEWDAKGEPTLESSCFEANDTGRYVAYHANKTPKEDYACRKGRPVGAYARMDADGTVLERGSFDSLGRKDGAWETFHPDGSPASLARYRGGVQEDSSFAWYENPTGAAPGARAPKARLKERGFFKDGTGELLGYDSLGHLAERRHFTTGVADGASQTFYPNGKQKSLITYKNGQPIEMAKWYADGTLWAAGTFSNGKKSGPWQEFDPHGRPTETSSYVDGVLEGEQVFYDSLGRVARSLRYEHGYPAEGRIPAGLGAPAHARGDAHGDSAANKESAHP